MSSNPGGGTPDPSMRPTSLSVLVVAGLAAAAAGWLLLSIMFYGERSLRLPLLPTIVFATLAVAEGMLAQNTSARIQHKSGAPRIDPLAVARFAVLAKASSLAGALFAGFSAGLLAWLALEPTKAARDEIPAAIAGVVAALALVGAALWLERACRVPERPDQKDGGGSGRPAGRS